MMSWIVETAPGLGRGGQAVGGGRSVGGGREKMEPVPEDSPRETRQLGDGVAGGLLGGDFEVGRQRGQGVAVGVRDIYEEAVSFGLWPPAVRREELRDAGADAVVFDLSGIDADPGRRRGTPHGPPSRAASSSAAAVALPAASQENSAARSGPAFRRRKRVGSSSSARSTWRASSATSCAGA